MEEWNSSAEIIAMSLIANSGAARSLAFEAQIYCRKKHKETVIS